MNLNQNLITMIDAKIVSSLADNKRYIVSYVMFLTWWICCSHCFD